jgi:hypothetical protein
VDPDVLKNNIFIFCKMRRGGRRQGEARGRQGARRVSLVF